MDPKQLKDISTEALLAELQKRKLEGFVDELYSNEEGLITQSREMNRKQLEHWLQTLSEEEGHTAKPCPWCGKLVRVKAKKRTRSIRSIHGTVTYTRNYHWCPRCKQGFYPIDLKAKIPETGEATESLIKRLLDFGVTEVETEAAQKFEFH